MGIKVLVGLPCPHPLACSTLYIVCVCLVCLATARHSTALHVTCLSRYNLAQKSICSAIAWHSTTGYVLRVCPANALHLTVLYGLSCPHSAEVICRVFFPGRRGLFGRPSGAGPDLINGWSDRKLSGNDCYGLCLTVQQGTSRVTQPGLHCGARPDV